MSSNISNLKKPRKVPFQSPGHRPVPFRTSSDSSDELASISSTSSGRPYSPKHRESLPKVNMKRTMNLNTTPSAAPSDNELLGSMMSRLAQLEEKLQSQTREIIEKDKKIKILQDKVKILNKAREEGSPTQIQELEKKCLLLQQQVHEMESFLSDYGMVWVGEKTDPDSGKYHESDDESELSPLYIGTNNGTDPLWRPQSSLANFEVDFDLVKKNVEELNAIAGEGISKIQHTMDGARLKQHDSIPLTLFANGIVMYSGPFRSYDEPTTQQCIKDLMDGYFPHELQKRYPDGVPINLTVKRDVLFKDKRHDIFKGAGQTLGGETKPSRLVPTNLDKSVMTSLDNTETNTSQNPEHSKYKYSREESELPGHKLSMEQFLQKLPSSVVKGGKIIDIRSSIGEQIKASDSQKGAVTVVDTAAAQEMKDRLDVPEEERPQSARDVTTLRIKSETGSHTYIVRMKFTDTIADVKRYINKQRPSKSDFDIMSAFPNKVYKEMNKTLEECGLTPNAALHLKAKK